MTRLRILCICTLLTSAFALLEGQKLEGRVIDSLSGKALEYVSVGIVGSPFGATTDDKGYFSFEARDQNASVQVRFSMIGYAPLIFTLEDILKRKEDFRLSESAVELKEVVVRAVKNERKVGATGFNRFSGWSGWGGMFTRRGYEMGTKISLGEQPVKVKALHVRLHRQAFDTSYCRLHVRSMEDTLIGEELLRENIIVSLDIEAGWAEIDLEAHNIWLSGDVAMTLEWLKVEGIQKDRAMKINDRMQGAYILFKNKKGPGGLYRWGTEAPWIVNENKSPSMYLSVLE